MRRNNFALPYVPSRLSCLVEILVRSLGLKIPEAFLARADQVIE
jgi:hypothetical protein